jgi:hypothetical protein
MTVCFGQPYQPCWIAQKIQVIKCDTSEEPEPYFLFNLADVEQCMMAFCTVSNLSQVSVK